MPFGEVDRSGRDEDPRPPGQDHPTAFTASRTMGQVLARDLAPSRTIALPSLISIIPAAVAGAGSARSTASSPGASTTGANRAWSGTGAASSSCRAVECHQSKAMSGPSPPQG
jgi:hypothetical protein